MVDVDSPDDFYHQIRLGGPIVAVFHALWCGDCHFLRPQYPEIEDFFSQKIDFISVDIDQFPELARAHEISGIPSFVLFAASREIFRFVNPRRKTKEEVIDFLEKGLALVPRPKEIS